MTKSSNNGHIWPSNAGCCGLCCILLTALSNAPSEAVRGLTSLTSELGVHSLELDSRVRWRETDTIAQRCFSVHLTAPGILWIELAMSTPSTVPEMVLFEPNTASGDKTPTEPTRLLQRVQSVMLEVNRPGDYLVCLTSQVPLGDAELTLSFLSGTEVADIRGKGGNDKEAEIEPDPAP